MSNHHPRIADARGQTGDLLKLPGMNAERVQTLMTGLQVRTCTELKRALASGRVVGLRGFSRELRSRLHIALAAEPDRS